MKDYEDYNHGFKEQDMYMTKKGKATISKIYPSPRAKSGSLDVWVNGKMRIYDMTGEVYNPTNKMNPEEYTFQYKITPESHPELFI